MSASPVVLGVNCAHDASACLLENGRPVSAITEERLTRIKHYDGFPRLAIDYCLEVGGVSTLADVDMIVLNEYPATDYAATIRTMGYPGELLVNPSHHLLHAYYAWRASGFDNAAVLILDGSGYSYGEHARRGSPLLGPAPPFSEMEEAETAYLATPQELQLVEKRWGLWVAKWPYLRFPSIGHMYSMASEYIFGHWQHAGKTMGLAPYGDPSRFPDPFIETSGDDLVIATDWVQHLPPRSPAPAWHDPICRDLAAKVQLELEHGVLHLCRRLHASTAEPRLCISGGVGLNSVVNGKILQETPFDQLFVTPAAGDAGTAIGAALYGHHCLTARPPTWGLDHDYLGRRYRRDEIDAALANNRGQTVVALPDEPEKSAAQDLAAGSIIAWYEGGSEFGPRALGHRSILCDPRIAGMQDRLNRLVKYREPFRPYAASVLAECYDRYFEGSVEDQYMLVVAQVRPGVRQEIPSVCHVDGSCRVQAVRRDHPGSFRRLIEQFEEITGTPLVLNTSFNIRGEPVVETPADAIFCFLGSNIDALYLDGIRVTKAASDVAGRRDLIPSVNPGIGLEILSSATDGRLEVAQRHVILRSGHRLPTGCEHADVLDAVDGETPISELASMPGLAALNVDAVTEVVLELAQRGVLSLSAVDNAHSVRDA